MNIGSIIKGISLIIGGCLFFNTSLITKWIRMSNENRGIETKITNKTYFYQKFSGILLIACGVVFLILGIINK